MGSYFEINDTLQITEEQGFPAELLDLEKHRKNPIKTEDFLGKVFSFFGKPGGRLFHAAPTRCFLVHNINGKWLYWGKIVIIEQTISGESEEKRVTGGKYKITEIYDPEYQEQITKRETDEGKSYF